MTAGPFGFAEAETGYVGYGWASTFSLTIWSVAMLTFSCLMSRRRRLKKLM